MPPARSARLAAKNYNQPILNAAVDPFQAALGLEHNHIAFIEVKRKLRELIKKHFNYNLRCSEQTEQNWDAFTTEALEHYPFMQDNADRLKNLKRYSVQYLSAAGGKHRASQNQCDDTFVRSPSTGAKLSPCSPVEANADRIPLRRKHQNFEIVIPPLTKKRCATRSPSQRSPEKIESTAAIGKFLESCQPCMSSLLPAFLQLGIKDDSSLDGILAWPKHELLQVLNKWKLNGILNELQVEALRIGFDKLRDQVSLNS